MADPEMILNPVSVPSAAEVIVQQLSRAIQLGRFLPGDQLPPEREFSVQLGVSRVTLRGALRELEESGLLERVRRGSGGGALVVADSGAGAGVETDAELKARRRDLEEIFEFRIPCEAAAAELAAERRTAMQLERIERAIGALSGGLSSAQFRGADNEFHIAIAAAAGNLRLQAAVEDARAAMFGPLDSIRFELVVSSTFEHHRRIYGAIATGDRVLAGEAMVEHIHRAQRELLTALAVADTLGLPSARESQRRR